jgi:hypothetical protein
MSLSPVTSSTSPVLPESPDEDASVTSLGVSDPMLALAELMINTDHLRSELDRQNLEAARQAQREAMQRQVASLHEAADDVRTGALFEGGAVVLGALTTGAGTLADSKLVHEAGGALHAMASPVGKLAGDAPRMHSEARAKQAEQEAEQAGWRADDARDHRRRVAENSDRTLDRVSQIIESEHAGNFAILANG